MKSRIYLNMIFCYGVATLTIESIVIISLKLLIWYNKISYMNWEI